MSSNPAELRPATADRAALVVSEVRPNLPRTLIALDFDGTLAPIVSRPADARLIDGADQVLRLLVARGASVAIITGRDAETVLDLSGLADLPGLAVAGLYGAQVWRGGRLATTPPPPELTRARSALPELVRAVSSELWIEDKGLSLVVHARGVDEPDAAIDALRPSVEKLAQSLSSEGGLEVHAGRQVLELRLAGFDKGRALREFVDAFGDASDRQLLYAGDDVGDLPAFAVVQQLREAGRRAWAVGVGSTEVTWMPADDSRVDAVVDGPAGLLSLLRGLLGG
ncbi:trehalose 6-phosphatase [Jatrophihabitans sp. GAS493]|uniref:trehalose-phosphatase n=1 Tax=Jatrophihabitans sp. GAS493 TaxID=1907575 RepID=UPI000BB8FD47|nr:trehalose-phosphatase [Jatrophihabitans sp. GAS493]SOD74932.1 trehalose 6-phosphatase [Jatrophihabitans sp. GAS493]